MLFRGPPLSEREAVVEVENLGFCLLSDEIGFRVSLYTSCSGISGIIVPLSEEKKKSPPFFYWHVFLSRLEALVFTWY